MVHHPHHSPRFTSQDAFNYTDFSHIQPPDVKYSTPHPPHLSNVWNDCPRCLEVTKWLEAIKSPAIIKNQQKIKI